MALPPPPPPAPPMRPPVPPPLPKTNTRGARVAWSSLAGVLCLALMLFLLASTVVLALIPLYLPNKGTSSLSSTGTSYITLTQQGNIPAYGVTSPGACSAIANAMGAAVGARTGTVTGTSCSFGSSASGRKRRLSGSLRRSRRQTTSATLYMTAIVNYALCPRCRHSSYVNSFIGRTFGSSFEYYGPRNTIFTIAGVSSKNFGGINTDPITAAPSG